MFILVYDNNGTASIENYEETPAGIREIVKVIDRIESNKSIVNSVGKWCETAKQGDKLANKKFKFTISCISSNELPIALQLIVDRFANRAGFKIVSKTNDTSKGSLITIRFVHWKFEEITATIVCKNMAYIETNICLFGKTQKSYLKPLKDATMQEEISEVNKLVAWTLKESNKDWFKIASLFYICRLNKTAKAIKIMLDNKSKVTDNIRIGSNWGLLAEISQYGQERFWIDFEGKNGDFKSSQLTMYIDPATGELKHSAEIKIPIKIMSKIETIYNKLYMYGLVNK